MKFKEIQNDRQKSAVSEKTQQAHCTRPLLSEANAAPDFGSDFGSEKSGTETQVMRLCHELQKAN